MPPVTSMVAGATVELLDGVTVIATTTTDAGGAYSFADVPVGPHTVRVLTPPPASQELPMTDVASPSFHAVCKLSAWSTVPTQAVTVVAASTTTADFYTGMRACFGLIGEGSITWDALEGGDTSVLPAVTDPEVACDSNFFPLASAP